MSEGLENQTSHLVQCKHEFQERLHQMQSPSAAVVRPTASQPENDYNIMNEINHICRLIKTNGYHGDFGLQMKFGEIVEAYGNGQVEKLSDVLAVARKNGFINYNLKDFLQQDRDEDIAIRLVKMPV